MDKPLLRPRACAASPPCQRGMQELAVNRTCAASCMPFRLGLFIGFCVMRPSSPPACLSHDRPTLPEHFTSASRSADRLVLGWVTCSLRSQEVKYLFPCVGLRRPDALGWVRGEFVDPPGGHRAGVQSPKPRCRARGCPFVLFSARPHKRNLVNPFKPQVAKRRALPVTVLYSFHCVS